MDSMETALERSCKQRWIDKMERLKITDGEFGAGYKHIPPISETLGLILTQKQKIKEKFMLLSCYFLFGGHTW